MHAAAKTFTIALVSVAAAAALGVSLANRTAAPAAETVKLARVVVVGQRMNTTAIAKLPRVVIEQRRAVPREVTMAQAQIAVWVA